jgi:SAM-dependent methyltransferase
MLMALIGAAGLYLSPKLSNNNRLTIEEISDVPISSSSVFQQQLRQRSDEQTPLANTKDGTNTFILDGSIAPVLLKDAWSRPTTWKQTEFMATVGHFPQFVKDLTVQPYRNRKNNEFCVISGKNLSHLLVDHDVLFFTNNQENEPFMSKLRQDYAVPFNLQHIDGFEVFSAMGVNHSHSFHAHGESWLGQVEGRRQWWFVPPTEPAPNRVNACLYLSGAETLPDKATSFVQHPGDVMWFPKDWYHATCALDDWTVGIGWQQGRAIRQAFPKLTRRSKQTSVEECLDSTPSLTETTTTPEASLEDTNEEWKWFNGDLNAYYNSLTTDENHKRNPNKVSTYAVHRWLTSPENTEEHYKLLYGAMERHLSADTLNKKPLNVLDAGCGLGAGLMWMEQKAPHWKLTGYTISEEQHKFITRTLPSHRFQARLQTFNDLKDENELDVIYSIEALIHSEDINTTLNEWAQHLVPGGLIVLIDDFLASGIDKTSTDIVDFAKSWLANSLVTIEELTSMTKPMGLELVEDSDLVEAYKIIENNYKNKKPDVRPVGGRTHQGWMGSKWRQRLTVEGQLKYNLVVLKKNEKIHVSENQLSAQCTAVPIVRKDDEDPVPKITPQLMSGHGDNGGQPISCISGWYCCDKGMEWHKKMAFNRTERKVDYLSLDKSFFGHYMEVFSRRLNEHYSTYSTISSGKFLDIGGTGSTAVGMKQVTSKFQNFVGPLEYWKLDSDPAAQKLDRTLYCDIDSCPAAENCGFDVTFSHTVLEHAKRPWLAFDTIARITKKGGLTMHLVPWSYQFHATPGDNFRFSHTALNTLLEDRGFEVLEVGYDICTKQDNKKTSIDEHYDVIWLTYVVGRKL